MRKLLELRQEHALRKTRCPAEVPPRVLVNALDEFWTQQHRASKASEAVEGPGAAVGRWMAREGDVLALRVGCQILHVLPHFRTLLSDALGGALLIALALASYPFQPHRMLSTLSGFVVVSSLLLTLVMFVAMDRDNVLSRLRGTTPGSISWRKGFLANVLVWVVLPFIGFLAVQYPEIASPFLSWWRSLLGATG
jgi:hypothetical protein